MKVKMIRGVSSLLLLVGLLAFSVPSYAKLVVLSYGFANSTEGFSINTTSDCGASFSMAASGSGGLTVSPDAGIPIDCVGTIEFSKIVVLSEAIEQPSMTMVIRNNNGLIDPDGCRVSFGDDATPDMLIRAANNGNTSDMVIAATISHSIGGQTEMLIRLPFHVRGGGSQFQIGEIEIASN